jgi:hypothetical protein
MEQIVASIRDVSVIVSEIAHASSEQNGGIQEVNLAITHIDEGTQQNAALVEQAAAAASPCRMRRTGCRCWWAASRCSATFVILTCPPRQNDEMATRPAPHASGVRPFALKWPTQSASSVLPQAGSASRAALGHRDERPAGSPGRQHDDPSRP